MRSSKQPAIPEKTFLPLDFDTLPVSVDFLACVAHAAQCVHCGARGGTWQVCIDGKVDGRLHTLVVTATMVPRSMN